MTKYELLLEEQRRKLLKAIEHLAYSYNKVIKLSNIVDDLDDEELEVWESFSARFSRVADFFLSKYLRTAVDNLP